MNLAPLQLEGYFLTDHNCQANPQFKADKPTQFSEKDLDVVASVQPIKNHQHRWQVSLNVRLQPALESNSPYSFCLNLVGTICWVGPEMDKDKLETVVRTNGPSMLYGAAREMARDFTARGPFQALVLPSVTFIPEALAAVAAKSGEPIPVPETPRETAGAAGAKD